MKSPPLLLSFDVALAATALWLLDQGRSGPAWSIFGALAALGVWQLALFSLIPWAARTLKVESFFRKTHTMQGCLQLTMYSYLGLYWPDVPQQAPLIFAQILFAYLCDMLLSWSLRRTWRAGFGTVPIVLSINLFLWFQDDYFYLQLVLIALTYFGKEFITWNYEGRRRHIFNPSGLSLSLVSVALLTTGALQITRGADIVGAFELPPNFYEVIFLLGLVVQILFGTAPITLGAAAAMYGVFLLTKLVYGEAFSSSPIETSVFLGLTFLVTDPATSPRSNFGKFLFGAAYGLSVLGAYILLRRLQLPAYFDKILVVPLVNLFVPFFESVGAWRPKALAASSGIAPQPEPLSRLLIARGTWVAAHVALFLAMISDLKAPKTRRPTLLPAPVTQLSPGVQRLVLHQAYCRTVHPGAYRPFGFLVEFQNRESIREIYQLGPPR
jgi:NQR2, RnfD, RnfE family